VLNSWNQSTSIVVWLVDLGSSNVKSPEFRIVSLAFSASGTLRCPQINQQAKKRSRKKGKSSNNFFGRKKQYSVCSWYLKPHDRFSWSMQAWLSLPALSNSPCRSSRVSLVRFTRPRAVCHPLVAPGTKALASTSTRTLASRSPTASWSDFLSWLPLSRPELWLFVVSPGNLQFRSSCVTLGHWASSSYPKRTGSRNWG